MALSKSEIELKKERRREEKRKIDKMTNWYMINFCWGVLAFLSLGLVERLFSSADTVLIAPTVMKIVAAVFAVGAIVVFVLGKIGKIKNTKRANDYAVFLLVIAVVSLIIGFYAQIRNLFVSLIPALGALRSEWWYSWSFRWLIGIYLLVGFIVVTVKIALSSRKRK